MKYWAIGYIILGLVAIVGWWALLPAPLFNTPYSTVLQDREEKIIGMTVAADGQFRFPAVESLPPKYIMALTTFEDKRFLMHYGVDWFALGRAMMKNIKSGRIVSGGSTISMQVIRLSRDNPSRTYWEKFREILLALRLEQTYSKYDILHAYAAHAPFGGNIVGFRAACLKYFDRAPGELSWAEAALLAVLPNAPSLKNDRLLKEKRDRLLRVLYERGMMIQEDYDLAVTEPLPGKVYITESIAPHLLAQAGLIKKGQVCRSTIDGRLQKQVNEIVARHSAMLSHNLIFNAAVLVAHIPSGEVRAYVGNSPEREGSRGNDVNIITSVRSSGSILKPSLYALMQQNGFILPQTLLSDIPSRFGSYAPSNFNHDFQGVAPADKALASSLNIPFVRLLKDYNYGRFYSDLKKLGIHSLNRAADDYGLSLILGGAETSLWDLCNMYGGMASVLRHYGDCDGQYYANEYERLKLWNQKQVPFPEGIKIKSGDAPLSAAAVWLTLNALKDVERPDMESGWKNFASNIDLSWKTGTSFGFRDAWALGVNADWVIGVWVGNADGEGRPGLVGVRAAAPVLFEVAGLLPVRGHFYEPEDEMKKVVVCKKSGYRASQVCDETDTIRVCEAGNRTGLCPYHRLINLDATTGLWRVSSECEPVSNIQVTPWFVLTPVQEWYYVRTHSDYRRLPPYRIDCKPLSADVMEMIYPQKGTRVLIPRDFDGKLGRVVFEVAHRIPATEIFWHVDDVYVGSTRNVHQLELNVDTGLHALILVDADGNTLRQTFWVVGE